MSKVKNAISTLCLTIIFLSAYSSPEGKDSPRYEVLMSSHLLNELKTNPAFIPSIDVSPRKLVLLASADQLYLLGWGGLSPLGQRQLPGIGSFAYTSDSLLMVVCQDQLSYLDETGKLSQLFKLPNTGMGLSRGNDVMYLYDRTNNRGSYALYVLGGGGKYTKLLQMPSPINSVAEFNNGLIFSNRNAVFYYQFKTKEFKALASLPKGSVIRSVAVDTTDNRVYFSTDKMVCSVKDAELIVLSDKLGGMLSYFHGLIVFDPESKLLIRLTDINNAIALKTESAKADPATTHAEEILTNSSIIGLVLTGIPEDQIIERINRSKAAFNLSVDSMIELSNQQVSSQVIMAMKQAMKKQSLNTP